MDKLLPLIFVFLGALGAAAEKPELLQSIDRFNRPESVVFSLDGKTLFVSNCASGDFGADGKLVGMVAGQGAISKLSVSENGHVEVVDIKFIEGLNAPVGTAVLPKATRKYPAGTLLVNQGISLLVDEGGHPVRAAELGTGILFFDPESGREIGRINLGAGSLVAGIIGHAALLPNSLAFDGEGNLYVTDTAKAGNRFDPPIPENPGLIRIGHGAIDEVSVGARRLSTQPDVTFTPIPGLPNGVGYWEEKSAICVVTMGGNSPEGTAVYVIAENSFPRRDLPEPLLGDAGTADGIAFTPAGTIITSRFAGDLLAIPAQGEPFTLKIPELNAPADHRLLTTPGGFSILAVPEMARSEPTPWNQRVRIIRIPAGF
ncbi:MAG: hypothetical protein ACC661_10345 [Verrucomicrobiales bacterium]